MSARDFDERMNLWQKWQKARAEVERLTRERDGWQANAAEFKRAYEEAYELLHRKVKPELTESRRLLERALAESEMPHDIHCSALPGKCWCWVKDARAHLAGGER